MAIIMIIIVISTLIGWMMTLYEDFNKDFPYGVVGGILSVVVPFVIIFLTLYWDKPTAIDVYRDKTTLEITYKDGVPIDSVVVYKNKKK